MTSFPAPPVNALVGFGLNSPNALRLVDFYEQAFGAQVERHERHDERGFGHWAGVRGGAARTVLKFGDATLEFLEFDSPGRTYPKELSPYDTRFQHFGVVVTDMRQAMETLNAIVGWTAISTDGPQTLPPSAGGVTAFKFRDPDGHPLEFLQFPMGKSPRHWEFEAGEGNVRGIDHSAISVLQVECSLNFYQSLGLHVSAQTLNQGGEQQRLDGISNPLLDVVALAPLMPTPHVELLHYRSLSCRSPEKLAINDIAAARLIMSTNRDDNSKKARGQLLQDPDGHFLEVRDRAER